MEFFIVLAVLAIAVVLFLGYKGYEKNHNSESAQLIQDTIYASKKDIDRIERTMLRYRRGKWILVATAVVTLMLGYYISAEMDGEFQITLIIFPLIGVWACYLGEKRYQEIRNDILLGNRDNAKI